MRRELHFFSKAAESKNYPFPRTDMSDATQSTDSIQGSVSLEWAFTQSEHSGVQS